MRCLVWAPVAALLPLLCVPDPAAADCADPAHALGVSRIVEIDTANGPLFGNVTSLAHEPTFLEPKEVVLTFDDGPIPRTTIPILDTLDKFCTKATFFSVGEMAIAYPKTIREVLARGHTIGTHTWSHRNLRHLNLDKATDEIERGFAAVSLAVGQPVAPFFRFPGFNDSDELMARLQGRGIAAFTVNVVSEDSYIRSADRLVKHTLKEINSHNGGIILFHDIKPATVKALPRILTALKEQDYKVVHLVPKAPLSPISRYDAELASMLAKTQPKSAEATPVVVTSATEPWKTLDGHDLPVTPLAPALRDRTVKVATQTAVDVHASTHPKAKHHHRWAPRRTRRAEAD